MNALPPVTLDVREILRTGGEPFSEIMRAVASLAQGQGLRLLATFKPTPLFSVMAQKGYSNAAHEIGGGDWEVLFVPTGQAAAHSKDAAPADAGSAAPSSWAPASQTLDTRGLEPPEPMRQALEAVEGLPPGAVIEVLTSREPLFLYRELRVRGHAFTAEARGADGYRVSIRRGGTPGIAA